MGQSRDHWSRGSGVRSRGSAVAYARILRRNPRRAFSVATQAPDSTCDPFRRASIMRIMRALLREREKPLLRHTAISLCLALSGSLALPGRASPSREGPAGLAAAMRACRQHFSWAVETVLNSLPHPKLRCKSAAKQYAHYARKRWSACFHASARFSKSRPPPGRQAGVYILYASLRHLSTIGMHSGREWWAEPTLQDCPSAGWYSRFAAGIRFGEAAALGRRDFWGGGGGWRRGVGTAGDEDEQ